MSNHSHESAPHPVEEGPRRVPRALFVIIILLFGALYWFAAYGDNPAPEKTVKTFYTAYFNRDYDTVAKNLSVFWSVRFLPQYAALSPTELLNNRAKIEADISKVIADIEKDNQIPKGISIEIQKEYTKQGQNSALVVYGFQENGKITSMETAVLIKENGQLRIFNMSPVDPETLEQIKSIDIKILDENFTNLMQPEKSK